PATAIDRRFVNRRLIDVGRKVLLRRIDNRGLGRDGYGSARDTLQRERDFQVRQTTDLDDDRRAGEGGKPGRVHAYRVGAGFKVYNAKATVVVSCGGGFFG